MLSLLSTLALAATAVFQAQALPAGCDRNVTVAEGDTCNSISTKYNVSTYQFAAVNINTGIVNHKCDNLEIGEVICLGIAGQDCTSTYIVQSGDTCCSIADVHDIRESTLLTNNPYVNQNCTNLYPDEVLCVSSTIYVDLNQPA